MHIKLFKIKEGKKKQWSEWCKALNTRLRDEAVISIKKEKVVYEAFGIFKIQ